MKRLNARAFVLAAAVLGLALLICGAVLHAPGEGEGSSASAASDAGSLELEDEVDLEESFSLADSLFASGEPQATTAESFLADLDAAPKEPVEAGATEGVESSSVSWCEERALTAVAQDVLSAYGELPQVELMASGFLDLKGNTWGAIVRLQNEAIDMMTVMCDEEDSESTVRVVRLNPLEEKAD